MGFARRRLEALERLWRQMLEHPFLLRTRDGELSDDVFRTWLEQDYLFVRGALPFVGVLLGKAPPEHYGLLAPVPPALRDELRLFEEQAEALGADLDGVRPGIVGEGYVHFLLATGFRDPYPVAFTAYYVAEKAYHESWKVVADGLDEASPWWPMVENWAGDAFGDFVQRLERALDGLADRAGAAEREAMDTAFERTVRWEIAFWEMALRGPAWPGLDPGPGPAAQGDSGADTAAGSVRGPSGTAGRAGGGA